MTTSILGNGTRKKLELVPLSNDVQSQIVDLSLDILEDVFSHMKAYPLQLSLQLNETTDVSNCYQIITLVVP